MGIKEAIRIKHIQDTLYYKLVDLQVATKHPTYSSSMLDNINVTSNRLEGLGFGKV